MNVIVFVADSLRADHLGCYGNDWIETPNVDRFAAEASLFEEAYSEGMPTIPCRTAFWTGRYTFPFRGWQPFEPEDVLLAEYLWDKGFTSCLVTDVYHMHKPSYNCGRGFDEVRFVRGQEYDPWAAGGPVLEGLDRLYRERGRVREGPDRAGKGMAAHWDQYRRNISRFPDWFESDENHFVAQVVREAVAWLERREKRGQRDGLFLWVDCFDPHEPWDPPEPLFSKYLPHPDAATLIDPSPGVVEGYMTPEEVANTKALYAGEVEMVDKWFGVFVDYLRSRGIWDESLVIFVSDHGEPFGEHGIIRKARPWPYVELARIPLLVRLPGGEGAGGRIAGFAQSCDLMPTVLDCLGLAPPEGTTGSSLVPLAKGEADSAALPAGAAEALRRRERTFACAGIHGAAWSARDREHSLILWAGSAGGKKGRELYDRAADPGETTDIARERPEVADAMELELRRFVGSLRWA